MRLVLRQQSNAFPQRWCGNPFACDASPSCHAPKAFPRRHLHRPRKCGRLSPRFATGILRVSLKKSHLSDAIEHKACCGDFDECLRALHAVLVILAQSSIAAKPSEAALHNPGEACDLERALPASDDLQPARE